MIKKRINKNGQFTQVITFIGVIFILAVTILLGRLILVSVYDGVQDAGVTTVQSNETMTNMVSQYQTFDYGIIIAAVALIIGLLITSFMIPTHPIFMAINIIGIFVLVFLGMILTNVYGELVSGDDQILGDQADLMPKTNFLIIYLPYLGAIIVLLASIVMFSRAVG